MNNLINEIKDTKAKMNLIQAITVGGDGFDTVVVPNGTFFNVPEKIGEHKIFESSVVEDGKIIFVNSKSMDNYGY